MLSVARRHTDPSVTEVTLLQLWSSANGNTPFTRIFKVVLVVVGEGLHVAIRVHLTQSQVFGGPQ